MHFSAGEVSIKNLSNGQRPAKKKFGKKQKTPAANPVALQRLFNTSTSEMGESTIADFSMEDSQVCSGQISNCKKPSNF